MTACQPCLALSPEVVFEYRDPKINGRLTTLGERGTVAAILFLS